MLPLDGVKVMDLSHAAAGPCCTMLLADMGAEVIKIESIGGESFRYAMNGANFVNLNRNKRGMALDLNSEEGREIALKLAAGVDVLVESFTPGTADRFGVGYDTVCQINPMIVYCSVSGFGQTGPYRERPAFDPVAQALSGIMITTGEADGPPVRVAASTVDYGTGMLGAYGIALALMNRQRNGKGEKIEVSLLDTALLYMSNFITLYSLTGQLPVRMGSGAPTFVPYQAFQAKDKLVFIGVHNERAWSSLCRVLELDGLVEDPRYATNDVRCQNRDELVETLNQVFKRYDSDELVTRLVAVDVPCAPVLNVDGVASDPHVIAREMIMDADYPGRGEVKVVGIPMGFSEVVPRVRVRAPLLGEHTNEVLRELGYGEAKIAELGDKGVVLQHTIA